MSQWLILNRSTSVCVNKNKKLRQQCMLITKYTKGECKQFKFMSKKEIIAVNYCISYLIVHWWYLYVQLLLENYFFMTYAAKFEVHAMTLTLSNFSVPWNVNTFYIKDFNY